MGLRVFYNRVMDGFTVYKVYWNRGFMYAQLALGVANLITFMIVSSLNKYFPSGSYYIILIIFGLVFFPALVGYPDYHYGTGKRENVFSYELNPKANDLYKSVKRMEKKLDRLGEVVYSKIPTTARVVVVGACIGCGACAAVCPVGLLEMQWNDVGLYEPREKRPCTALCGKCLSVCPHASMVTPPLLGEYLSAYAGYAGEGHRERGASGGVASWLLEKLLVDKIVDRVICVTPTGDSDRLFEYEVVEDVDGVRRGAGSAYYPVELSGVLRHVLEVPGRYAITGVPCFIRAVRLAQREDKRLAERIILTLGIVCGQMKTRRYTGYVAGLAGVKGPVTRVRYRGKNHGGRSDDYYYLFNGEKKMSWHGGVMKAWFDPAYTPQACGTCRDVFAEKADVVFMDAWLPEYIVDGRGTSLVLVRSPLVKGLVEEGVRNRSLFLEEVPVEKILESQRASIENKRGRCV